MVFPFENYNLGMKISFHPLMGTIKYIFLKYGIILEKFHKIMTKSACYKSAHD